MHARLFGTLEYTQEYKLLLAIIVQDKFDCWNNKWLSKNELVLIFENKRIPKFLCVLWEAKLHFHLVGKQFHRHSKQGLRWPSRYNRCNLPDEQQSLLPPKKQECIINSLYYLLISSKDKVTLYTLLFESIHPRFLSPEPMLW